MAPPTHIVHTHNVQTHAGNVQENMKDKCHNGTPLAIHAQSTSPITASVLLIKAAGPFPQRGPVNSTWPRFKVITNPFDIVQTGAISEKGYSTLRAIGCFRATRLCPETDLPKNKLLYNYASLCNVYFWRTERGLQIAYFVIFFLSDTSAYSVLSPSASGPGDSFLKV